MKIESNTYTVAGATGKVVTTYAARLTRVQGYFNGVTADRWLQLHDSKITPAAGAVPLKSWPIYMTAPFDQNFQNDAIAVSNGMTFVVSTTQETYTASTDTMDLFVTGVSDFDSTGITSVGNYSIATSAAPYVISSDAAAPKKLVRLDFNCLVAAGNVLYAKVFASDAPTIGDMPVVQMVLPDGESKDFWFDKDVYAVLAGEKKRGICVVVEPTAGAYAGGNGGASYATVAFVK